MGLVVFLYIRSDRRRNPLKSDKFKGRPRLGFQASLLKLQQEVLLTVVIKSWVRQLRYVAPKNRAHPGLGKVRTIDFIEL